ncbi:MAG: LysR family transcriptional regulator [Pseudomonadota bacterium]|nr:LysR family transcriptional regulator [Pseudomonadota bacterium]
MLNKIDLSRTDLNLLSLFEVIWQERHVGRAAAKLNLSPSAVSHGLSRLRRLLNDPLFIRHPRGLNPTERAIELSRPVGDVLARARAVIASAEPFEPSTSRRQFVVAAVDGVGSVILPTLIKSIRSSAPGVTVRIRTIYPLDVVDSLDRHDADLAVAPLLSIPPRLVTRELYQDDFVVAARRGHPFLARPTLKNYCAASHLLVGAGVDSRGFVDEALAKRGLQRHVALTVPSFMWALTVLAQTDLLGAVPRRLVEQHGRRAGLAAVEPPLPLRKDGVGIVTVRAAMADPAMQWLVQQFGSP